MRTRLLLFGAVVMVVCMSNPVDCRKNGRAALRAMGLLKTNAELLIERLALNTESSKSCLNLATCHLATGDLLRGMKVSHEVEYDKARKYIRKYHKWTECGVDRINEKCRALSTKCWTSLRMTATDSDPDLIFMNRCSPDTIPYMLNLCVGSRKGHWPEDVFKNMSQHYPGHCSKSCSAFRQFNRYHLKKNVTEFPQGWSTGLSLGVDDEDNRAWANQLFNQAKSLGYLKRGGGSGGGRGNKFEPRNAVSAKLETRARDMTTTEFLKCIVYPDCRDWDQNWAGSNIEPGTCYDITLSLCSGTTGIKSVSRCNTCRDCKAPPQDGFIWNARWNCESCQSCQVTRSIPDAVKPKPLPTTTPKPKQPDDCLTLVECNVFSCKYGTNCRKGANFLGQDCNSCDGWKSDAQRMDALAKNQCVKKCKSVEYNCAYYRTCPMPPPTTTKPPTTTPLDLTISCNFYANNSCPTMKPEKESLTEKEKGLNEDWEKCNGTKTCEMDLIHYPWQGGLDVYAKDGFIKQSQQFETQKSSCRVNSWVGTVYSNFPYSVFGLCAKESREPFKVLNQNYIRFVSTNGNANLTQEIDSKGTWTNCERGFNTIPSYIVGAEFTYTTKNNFTFIESARWFCSGRDEEWSEEIGTKKNVICPHLTLLCWIKTIVGIDTTDGYYKIQNVNFGCCDVPARMYYSATNYERETHRLPEAAYYFNVALVKNPPQTEVTQTICPPGHFIKSLVLNQLTQPTLQFDSIYEGVQEDGFVFKTALIPQLVKFNFMCADPRNQSIPSNSISNEFYSSIKDEGNTQVITCPEEMYTFGIEMNATDNTQTKYGKYEKITEKYKLKSYSYSYRLLCSNNTNDSKSGFSEISLSGLGYIAKNTSIKCKNGFALCGIEVESSFENLSGFEYNLKCCPIPVRIQPTLCTDGVEYSFEKDVERSTACKGNAECSLGNITGTITGLRPSAQVTTDEAHYPDYERHVAQAILTATNIKYGVNYELHFQLDTRSTYQEQSSFALELRLGVDAGTQTDGSGSKTIFEKIGKMVSTANSFAGGFNTAFTAFTTIKNIIDPPIDYQQKVYEETKKTNMKLDKISSQLDTVNDNLVGIRDTIKASQLYNKVFQDKVALSVVLQTRNSPFGNRTEPVSHFFNFIAKCGTISMDMGYDDMFYYVPLRSMVSGDVTDERLRPLPNKDLTQLNNLKGTAPKNLTIRFSNVGLTIKGEQESFLTHVAKWDDLIKNVTGDCFRLPGPSSKQWNEELQLFKRPNNTKHYFVNISIPAGEIAYLYQLIASCNAWDLYTDRVYFISGKEEPDIRSTAFFFQTNTKLNTSFASKV